MELKDFISETILQIVSGVIDATVKCKDIDVIVNPDVTVGKKDAFWIPSNKKDYKLVRRVQQIDMDICVTVTENESNELGAKAGIFVFAIGANSKGTKENKNENRVRFSIPVCLPVSEINLTNDKK